MATQARSRRTTRSALRRVPFSVRVPEAADAAVTGDFTQWSEDGIRLQKAADGAWETTLELAPGEYQYRLRIDGEWRNHADASRRIANPFGTENDVLTIV